MTTRATSFLVGSVLLALAGTGPAAAPNFTAAVYGDGEVWGTKGNATLPAPNAHNVQSYDGLYVIVNSNAESAQLPVSEAAPGNPDYNGGRWFTHTVMWTDAGFDYYGTVPVLKSFDELLQEEEMGHLVIAAGSFDGGPRPYFQCPLLPVK